MNTTRRSFLGKVVGMATALGLGLRNTLKPVPLSETPLAMPMPPRPFADSALPEFERLPEKYPPTELGVMGLTCFRPDDDSFGGFYDHGTGYVEPVNRCEIGMEFQWRERDPSDKWTAWKRGWLHVNLRYGDTPDETAEKLELFAARLRARQFGAYNDEIRAGTGVNDNAPFVLEAQQRKLASAKPFPGNEGMYAFARKRLS